MEDLENLVYLDPAIKGKEQIVSPQRGRVDTNLLTTAGAFSLKDVVELVL